MVEFDCYSSWVRRDDIIGITKEVSGSAKYEEPSINFSTDRAIDGFHCRKENYFMYHSTQANPTFFQVDLKNVYTLKCVRVTTREVSSRFVDVEFRFGNESQGGNYRKNPVFAVLGLENKVDFEFCLDYPIVGRYLGLRQNKNTWLLIGEIQVTVQ